MGVAVGVVHAFYRRPFPAAQSLQAKGQRSDSRVRGQICLPGCSGLRLLWRSSGTPLSQQWLCCSPWRLSRRMRPEGRLSRAPGSLPPRTPAPGSCPILHLSPFPSAHTQLGVPVRPQPRRVSWSQCRGPGSTCVGCLAWEGWGAHLAYRGPSPLPRHVWPRDWPLPGTSRPACGRQRGHRHSRWQRVRKGGCSQPEGWVSGASSQNLELRPPRGGPAPPSAGHGWDGMSPHRCCCCHGM